MDDSLLMRFVHSERDLADRRGDLAFWLLSARLDEIGQRPAVDEAHREIPKPILRADFVHRANVRMVERRRTAGLAEEPLIEVPGDLAQIMRNLEGNHAIELHVAGEIDAPHRPLAKLLFNAIAAQFRGRNADVG